MSSQPRSPRQPRRRTGPTPRRGHRSREAFSWGQDPPPTTPYEVVDEGGLLRLRHYRPEQPSQRVPVVLVYALLKRPYILDLQPDRSVVRNFLRQGFPVYLTEWIPPAQADAWRGFDAYVNQDLARAVECVQSREDIERVSLVGYCFGGLLSVIYAALHPKTVSHLVPFALPFEMRMPLAPQAVDYIAGVFGNCPAWLIRTGLDAVAPSRFYLPFCHEISANRNWLARAGLRNPPWRGRWSRGWRAMFRWRGVSFARS